MAQALWVELESVIAQNQLTVESIVKVAQEEQVKVVHVVTDHVEEGQAGRLACKVIENWINNVLIRNSTGQHIESLEVITGSNKNNKRNSKTSWLNSELLSVLSKISSQRQQLD